MENKVVISPKGFTLAEVIVSLLLLSILTIGSFKTFHFIQLSANSNFKEFKALQIKKQLFAIAQLNVSFPNVTANDYFVELNCIIEFGSDCP